MRTWMPGQIIRKPNPPAMPQHAHARVVLLVKGDIVVAGDDELELRGGVFQHGDHGLVLMAVADFGDVAGVQQDVGAGERVAITG